MRWPSSEREMQLFELQFLLLLMHTDDGADRDALIDFVCKRKMLQVVYSFFLSFLFDFICNKCIPANCYGFQMVLNNITSPHISPLLKLYFKLLTQPIYCISKVKLRE